MKADELKFLFVLDGASLRVLPLSLLVVEISLDLDSLLSERCLDEIPLSESVTLGALEVLEYSIRDFLSPLLSMEYLDLYSVTVSP